MSQDNLPLEESKYIVITKEEYYRLLDESLKLQCFNKYGVDNWEGYDLAITEYLKIIEEDEVES